MEILTIIIGVVATLVIAVIGVIGAFVLTKIGKGKDLTNIASAVDQIIQAASITVGELQQTVVEGLKEAAVDGKLSDDEIDNLKDKVIAMTMAKLSDPVLMLAKAAAIDVNAIITGAAESLITRLRG